MHLPVAAGGPTPVGSKCLLEGENMIDSKVTFRHYRGHVLVSPPSKKMEFTFQELRTGTMPDQKQLYKFFLIM